MDPMQPGYLDRRVSRHFQVNPHAADKKWRQHETQGKYGPRSRVTHTRTMPDGSRLYLCSQHTELWRELDAKSAPKKQKAAKK